MEIVTVSSLRPTTSNLSLSFFWNRKMNFICTEEKTKMLKMAAVHYLNHYYNSFYNNLSSVSAFVSRTLIQTFFFFPGQMIEIMKK